MDQLLLEEVQFSHSGDPELVGTGLNTYRTLKRLCKPDPPKVPPSDPLKPPPPDRLKVAVPDTLIFGLGFKHPTLVYTTENGEVRWKKGIEHFQFKKVLAIFKHLNECQSTAISPLFILKTDQYRRIILRRAEALDEWRSREKQPLECQMQRFVMPKGRQTCKLRVISVPQGFKAVMLTNRLRIDGKRDADFTPLRESGKARQHSDSPKSQRSTLPPGSNINEQAKFYQKVIERRLAQSVARLTVPSSPPRSRPTNPRATRPNSTSQFNFDHDDNDLRQYFIADGAPVNIPQKPISQLYSLLDSEPKRELEEIETDARPLPSDLAPVLRERFCTDSTDYKKTSACNIKSGKLIRPALLQVKLLREKIDKKLLQPRNQRLISLVCDFCEDREGVWWLLKIKSFTSEPLPAMPARIKYKPPFKCPGDYCNIAVPLDEHYSFIGRDSVKFLYSGEMSDLHSKHTTVLYELSKKTMLMDKILKSGDSGELGDLLNPRLLERVRVCYNCFHIYKDKERAFFNAELSLLKRSRKERWEKAKTMKMLSEVNDVNNMSGKPDAILKPRIYSAHSQTLLLLERRIPDTSQHMREMGKHVTSMLKEEREKSKSYFTLHQPAPAPLKKVLPAVTSESKFKTKLKDISRYSDPDISEPPYQNSTLIEDFE